MKNIKFWASFAFTLAILSSIVLIPPSALAQNELKGNFSLARYPLKPVPKAGSLDKVKVIEIFSISCIHCYNFSKVQGQLITKYGSKLDLTHYDVGWLGDNLTRFIFLSDEEKKGDTARELLFKAYHEAGIKDLNNPKTLKVFANQIGLPADFETMMKKPSITASLANSNAYISRFRVDSTPTFIVEDSIIVRGDDPLNLSLLISSLLKNPPK